MTLPSSAEVRRLRPLLGTFVEIRAGGTDRNRTLRAVEVAYQRMARIQELMSFHSATSEISRLNRRAWRSTVQVTAETYSVLAVAQRIAAASAGAFDITVAPFLVRWGYLPAGSHRDHRPRARARTADWRDVELLSRRRIRFRRRLLLDLGGIAKGYAVDLAVNVLRDAGVPAGVVNAGGDLRAFGEADEPIHVRLPGSPGRFLAMTTLRNAAVATSAAYFARRVHRGCPVSPVVDPLDGRPCLRLRSASVRAAECVLADALTKVLMLRGEDALPVLRTFSAHGYLVTARGELLTSEPAHVA
jgi:FAD:protein FMN transferase